MPLFFVLIGQFSYQQNDKAITKKLLYFFKRYVSNYKLSEGDTNAGSSKNYIAYTDILTPLY